MSAASNDHLTMTPKFQETWLKRLYQVLPGPSLVLAAFVIWQAEYVWWALLVQVIQTGGNIGMSVFNKRWPWLEKDGHIRVVLNGGGLFLMSLAAGPEAFVWLLGMISCFGAVFSPTRALRLYALSTSILGTLAGMAMVGTPALDITAAGLMLTSISIITMTVFQALLRTTRTLQQRQEEAQETNRDLVAALAARQAFLATMSHEVRTPLNGVLGMAELLTHTELDEDQRQMLSTVQQSGTGLLQVLNDILDTAKLDAGTIELESIPYDPSQLAESVVDLLSASTHKDDLVVRVTRGPLPVALLGDPARLRQILLNLVGNAIKFTDQGSVDVHLSWGGQRLRVAIRDSGIGIAEEHLEGLFEPFTQAEAGTTRRYGGTGLGLAICKRLVETMEGTLSVQSVLGEGSEFTFEVYAPISELEVAEEEVVQVKPVSCHVLLVDDNLVNLMVTRRMLETLGCSARSEDDGQNALAALEEEAFDIVLMDCRMPGMDGFEATRRLRAKGMTLPVLALTAGVTQAERARCEAAGMDEVLPKPLKLDSLRSALAYWTSQNRASA
jgi:signal transduction histidine kinase/CheY-like chemotaxis protein